jgi:hypothetical protein
MQIKTTMRYSFIPVRLAVIKETKKIVNAGKSVEEKELLSTICRK